MPAPDGVTRGAMPADDATGLSLLYHLNSEPWLDAEAYEEAAHPGTPLHVDDAPRRGLPAPVESPLGRLLSARRSCRSFAPRSMALEALGELLAAAAGVTERATISEGIGFLRRGAPSAGGRFPLDTYAFIRDVEGLADGIHRYDPLAHDLSEIARADVATVLRGMLYAYPFVHGANAVVAFVATFARTQDKYGPRGYRYILLEAGHCAQSLCLRATELEVATLCIGGFADGEVNRVLALDPREAGVVYMVAAGYAAAGG